MEELTDLEKEHYKILMSKEKEELVNIILLKDRKEDTDSRYVTLIRRNEALKEKLRNQQINTENGFRHRDKQIKKLREKIFMLRVDKFPGQTIEMHRENKKKIKIKMFSNGLNNKKEKE